MVTITSPQSAVVARNSFTLTWTCTYPQKAYEIMYRKAGETAWSTFGKVYSTAKSISVDCSRFEDFLEYHYRVAVYSEYDDTQTTSYSGTDLSDAFAIIMVPPAMVGTMKAKYGDGMIEIPLYSTITPTTDSIKLNIAPDKKTRVFTDQPTYGYHAPDAGTDGYQPIPKTKVCVGAPYYGGGYSLINDSYYHYTGLLPGNHRFLSNPAEYRKTYMTSRYTYYTLESYTVPLGHNVGYYYTYYGSYLAMAPQLYTYDTYAPHVSWYIYSSNGKYAEALLPKDIYLDASHLAYFIGVYGRTYTAITIPIFAKAYNTVLNLQGYLYYTQSLSGYHLANVYGVVTPYWSIYASDHFYSVYATPNWNYSFSYSMIAGEHRYYLKADNYVHQMVPTQYYWRRYSWPIILPNMYYAYQSFSGTIGKTGISIYYTYSYRYYNDKHFTYHGSYG